MECASDHGGCLEIQHPDVVADDRGQHRPAHRVASPWHVVVRIVVFLAHRGSDPGTDPPNLLQVLPFGHPGQPGVLIAGVFRILEQNVGLSELLRVGKHLGDVVDGDPSCSHRLNLLHLELLLLLRRHADGAALGLPGLLLDHFPGFLSGTGLQFPDLESAFLGHVRLLAGVLLAHGVAHR